MGFSARQIKIYRKTTVADTFASLGTTEKLALNSLGKDEKIANGWTTRVRVGAPRDIVKHDNPNENLSEQQDTGLDENVYEFKGIISRADLVTNIFMNNLIDWNEEQINGQESTVLPYGRFAFDIDRAPKLSQQSNATTGMEISSLTFEFIEDEPNLMEFTLTMTKGKGT